MCYCACTAASKCGAAIAIITNRKLGNSAKHIVQFFIRLFILGEDFMKLCRVIDTDAVYFYKLSFATINRLVRTITSISVIRVLLFSLVSVL